MLALVSPGYTDITTVDTSIGSAAYLSRSRK